MHYKLVWCIYQMNMESYDGEVFERDESLCLQVVCYEMKLIKNNSNVEIKK